LLLRIENLLAVASIAEPQSMILGDNQKGLPAASILQDKGDEMSEIKLMMLSNINPNDPVFINNIRLNEIDVRLMGSVGLLKGSSMIIENLGDTIVISIKTVE